MPGLDISQLNTRSDQPAGRTPGPASNDPAQEFAAVSRLEQQRIDQRRTEHRQTEQGRAEDRQAQLRAERDRADQRLQDKRAENRQVASDIREKNTQSADRNNRRERAREAENAAESGAHEKAENQASYSENDGKTLPMAESESAGPDQHTGETAETTGENLPLLPIALPVSANDLTSALKPASTGTSGSTSFNLLQGNSGLSGFFNRLASGDRAGNSGDKGLGSEALNGVLFKGAAGDAAKTSDFSTQLARLQMGGDNPTLQNNATSLQRSAETMAPLKSYATSVDLPVQQAEWGERIAGKLAWLTSQRMSAAEIHITPADMGPLDVRVQVHNDQAHVTVHASNSAVRDQLELNGHRLRDMLQENGLNLDSFEVSAEAHGEGRDGAMSEDQGAGAGGSRGGVVEGDDHDVAASATGSLDLSLRGEVDTYA